MTLFCVVFEYVFMAALDLHCYAGFLSLQWAGATL